MLSLLAGALLYVTKRLELVWSFITRDIAVTKCKAILIHCVSRFVFWWFGWRGLKCFSPLRATYSKATYYLSFCYIFPLNSLKGSAKARAVDLVRRKPLKGTRSSPRPFHMRVLPGLLGAGANYIMRACM